MEFKLDFDPEEMAKKMSDAIVQSTFKTLFEKAVQEEIDRLNKSTWDRHSIIRTTVESFIKDCMNDILHKEYEEMIKNKLREGMSGEKLDQLVSEFVMKIRVGNY